MRGTPALRSRRFSLDRDSPELDPMRRADAGCVILVLVSIAFTGSTERTTT